LDNHDQSRIASSTDLKHLDTLYSLLYTLPGIPSVYYGSEWGIRGIKEGNSDHALRPYIDIENRQSYSTNLTGHISRLALIRQREKALKYGNYQQVYLEYRRPFIFARSFENEQIFVAVNIADCEQAIDLSAHGGGFRDLLEGGQISTPRRINLKPHTVRVLKRL
jgi:glycosidase